MAKLNLSLFVLLLVQSACTTTGPALPAENQVAVRLAKYTELLRHQNASELSAMFEPAGSLRHQGQSPIVGRDAIRAFLLSFANYKVLSHEMQVLSAIPRENEVTQTGTFTQAVLTPEGRRVEVRGTFTAVWRRGETGEWLIASMRTAPPAGG